MSDIFFRELGLRKPDYRLAVRAKTLSKQIANIIEESGKLLMKENPDALLVLGDTNSSLSAVVARRLKIPIFHLEAGNRAFDWDVPEETNRRIVDHISDFNLAYTEHARRYLIAEGIHPGSIYVTGSPYPEIFKRFETEIAASKVLDELGLDPQKYFLVSTHREENVESETRLRELFNAFKYLARIYHLPVVVSLHPRTRKRVDNLGRLDPLIRLHEPFGFFEYARLEKDSLCVLSDSGTIPEETAPLKLSAVQIRASSERPEAFDAGLLILTGFNRRTIASAVSLVIEEKNRGAERAIPIDYLDPNFSSKVVKLVLGLTSISKNDRPIGTRVPATPGSLR